MKLRRSATREILAIAAVLLTAVVVEAAPITFAFTGVVSQDPLLDPDDPFAGTIAFGTLSVKWGGRRGAATIGMLAGVFSAPVLLYSGSSW